MKNNQNPCPLCLSPSQRIYDFYFQCDSCNLVFKDSGLFLNQKSEKARYDLHNNNLEDENYIFYLNQLLEVFQTKIDNHYFLTPKNIWDFGCGPVKGYEFILKNKNHKVDSFDPFYFPDEHTDKNRHPHNLISKYELIIASESAEHFYQPGLEFEKIVGRLKSGGYLAIRTELYEPSLDLKSWWYAKDPTHMVFYSRPTFEWLARHYDLKLRFLQNPYIILQMP